MKNKTKIIACAILVGILFFLFNITSADSQTGKKNTSDTAAIRKVINEFNDAWTARSADRYVAVFTADADWENAFGGHLKGRDEIKALISQLVNQFTTAEEKITNTRIWQMSENFALVDIYQTIDGQKLPKSGRIVPTRHIRMSQIYEKQKGIWRIKVHRVTDLREKKQNDNNTIADSTSMN